MKSMEIDAGEPELQIADQRADRPTFLTKIRFDEFDLPSEVLAGLKDAGFVHCTPIQAEVLPLSLTGRDVAGQAQTGTGKTAAFLTTLFTRLLSRSDRKPGLPSGLIVAPTRELALQIYDDAEVLGRHTPLSLAAIVGGIGYRKQAETLRRGADIVICTPGRIIDYFKQGIFKTPGIEVLVIDEADRLFDLGFTKDMRYILRKLPHYEKRQSMLFSATLSHRVLALTYDYMNLPEFISVTPEEVTVEGVEESLFHVGRNEKLSLLLGLLEREDWERVLVFVNTKAGVEWLTEKLKGNGLPVAGITGDLLQRKRLRLMQNFKEGRTRILLATDVASRGIHVEDISHVINYDLPQDPENYIHRIGRTARAGKAGRALSFASEDTVYYLEPIEKILGYKIPVLWPKDSWFAEDKSKTSLARRRLGRKRPDRGSGLPRDKKRPSGRKPGKMTIPQSKPDSIFGLAPGSKSEEGQKSVPARKAPPQKKRKKRRGRRRKEDGPK